MSSAVLDLPTASPPSTAMLLTAEEVAEILRVPVSRIWQLSREGTLPTVRLGRTCRYRPQTVAAWLEEQES